MEMKAKKRYEIYHKPTHTQAIWFAASPEEACKALGWRPRYCDVKEITNDPPHS